MADDGFNGTTITFAAGAIGAAAADLRSISVTESAAEVDVTGSGDLLKRYETGVPDIEMTVEVVGPTTLDVGDEGAVVITWNHAEAGAIDGIDAAVITAVDTAGNMDGEVTSTVKFRPTPV